MACRGYAVSVGGTAMGVNGAGARTVEGGNALLRDGADVLAPILADGAATYVPGVSERRSGATSYLHGGDKNAEARTSSTGAVTGTRSYDAFGGTLSSTAWTGPAGYGGAFGYREDGTTFRLVGHRLYDPTAGRFLSRDPARDGHNWYAYRERDPVNSADPEGQAPVLVTLVIAIALVIVGSESAHAPTLPGGPGNEQALENHIKIKYILLSTAVKASLQSPIRIDGWLRGMFLARLRAVR